MTETTVAVKLDGRRPVRSMHQGAFEILPLPIRQLRWTPTLRLLLAADSSHSGSTSTRSPLFVVSQQRKRDRCLGEVDFRQGLEARVDAE